MSVSLSSSSVAINVTFTRWTGNLTSGNSLPGCGRGLAVGRSRRMVSGIVIPPSLSRPPHGRAPDRTSWRAVRHLRDRDVIDGENDRRDRVAVGRLAAIGSPQFRGEPFGNAEPRTPTNGTLHSAPAMRDRAGP